MKSFVPPYIFPIDKKEEEENGCRLLLLLLRAVTSYDFKLIATTAISHDIFTGHQRRRLDEKTSTVRRFVLIEKENLDDDDDV